MVLPESSSADNPGPDVQAAVRGPEHEANHHFDG